MTRPLQLRRLHFLNALFAPLTGHDLYLAQQIDDAISTSLGEAVERAPSDPSFVAAAAKLFERLCSAHPQHGFFHWDASAEDTGATPLFTRAGVMQGLKQLAVFPESTLLVTNLRAACHKRPIDNEQMTMLIEDVLDAVEAQYDNQVPTSAIGEHVMQRLRKTDQVAYVRFASVYKEFRDVAEFVHEISSLAPNEGAAIPKDKK